MIRDIVTSEKALSAICKEIKDPDLIYRVIVDLIHTAQWWETQPVGCVGLAANQIGLPHRIIIIKHGGTWLPMINPEIEYLKGPKDHRVEACLSRPGRHVRKQRYKKIRVRYWDENEDLIEQKFTGFAARVIQHEVDHLNGRFI